MMSQLSQLAGLAAGLSILTSILVLALGAYALVLTIRFLRLRLEKDGLDRSVDESR